MEEGELLKLIKVGCISLALPNALVLCLCCEDVWILTLVLTLLAFILSFCRFSERLEYVDDTSINTAENHHFNRLLHVCFVPK